MPGVVADSSPLFYLLSIGRIELLPILFGTVYLPKDVQQELNHPAAPPVAQDWARRLPTWVQVMPVDDLDDPALLPLGAGERAAIALATGPRQGF